MGIDGPARMTAARLAALFAIATLAIATIAGADGPKMAHQAGVWAGLTGGALEGDVSVAELQKLGNMGIGAFDRLDGEMAALDGVFYRIKFDGGAQPATGADITAFAVVADFAPDRTVQLAMVDDIKSLAAALDRELASVNFVWAARIDGKFALVKARSVPGFSRPFPRMAEIIKAQSALTYENVEGTLIGFRYPEFAGGVNYPGWHFHFLTQDRRRGGHALDVKLEKAQAALMRLDGFSALMPKGEDFSRMNLAPAAK